MLPYRSVQDSHCIVQNVYDKRGLYKGASKIEGKFGLIWFDSFNFQLLQCIKFCKLQFITYPDVVYKVDTAAKIGKIGEIFLPQNRPK